MCDLHAGSLKKGSRWREIWAQSTSLLRSLVQVERKKKQESKCLGTVVLKVGVVYEFPIAGTN